MHLAATKTPAIAKLGASPLADKMSPLVRAYMAHRTRLINVAAGIVGSSSRAEDVVQEAYLRVNQAGDHVLNEPIGYLYRTVRNLAVDLSRRQSFEKQLFAADELGEQAPADRPTPEDEALHKNELNIVMAALTELPDRTQRVLRMYRFEDLKLREIAERLDISVSLAQSLVSDGMEHCRQRLRRGHDEDQ